MENKKHLPLFGAGPAYVVTITICTLVALVLHYMGMIPQTVLPETAFIALRTASVLLVILGIFIWCSAVFSSRLTRSIKENRLLTDGVYALVRHPVYSAFTLAEWGLLFWTGNLLLFPLIPMYWIFLSLLMKETEEKWLLEKYGSEYEEYCRRVNRCIPWFPKKNK